MSIFDTLQLDLVGTLRHNARYQFDGLCSQRGIDPFNKNPFAYGYEGGPVSFELLDVAMQAICIESVNFVHNTLARYSALIDAELAKLWLAAVNEPINPETMDEQVLEAICSRLMTIMKQRSEGLTKT